MGEKAKVATTATVRTVGPEEALDLLENAKYENQRPSRSWWVVSLSEFIRKGTFLQGTPIIIAQENDGNYLLDGKHRMWAVVETGEAQEFTVITYNLKGVPEDVARETLADIYSRIDTGLPRTFTDAYKAHRLDQLFGMSNSNVEAVGAAIRMMMVGFDRPDLRTHRANVIQARDRDERMKVMQDYEPEARLFFEAIATAHYTMAKTLRSAPVLAVGLVTLRHKREKAWQFWSRIAKDDKEERGHPVHTTIRLLNEEKLRMRGPLWYARAVARGWNAFYNDKQLSRILGINPEEAIRIDGTPFTGIRPESVVLEPSLETKKGHMVEIHGSVVK